jgi:hypothetical protein
MREKQAGLMFNQEAGTYEQDPNFLRQSQLKDQREAMEKGLIPRMDEQGLITGFDRDPSYVSADDKALRRLQMAEDFKIKAEDRKANRERAKKPLPAGEAVAIGGADSSVEGLNDVRNLVETNAEMFGPIAGRLQGFLGSAGMSSDFEIAVAHGATHLRVGSEILGSRTYHP